MNYFRSFKNYLDITQIILITSTVASHIIWDSFEDYKSNPILPVISSFASLILWANFLYFLRLFSSTSKNFKVKLFV